MEIESHCNDRVGAVSIEVALNRRYAHVQAIELMDKARPWSGWHDIGSGSTHNPYLNEY